MSTSEASAPSVRPATLANVMTGPACCLRHAARESDSCCTYHAHTRERRAQHGAHREHTSGRAPQRRRQCGWAMHGGNRDEVTVRDTQRQVEQQRERVCAAWASTASATLQGWSVQHRPRRASTDWFLQRSLPGGSAPKDHRQAPRPRRDDMAHKHGGSHESACSRVGPKHAHARRLHGPAPASSRHAAEQVPAIVDQEEEGHPQLACARRSRLCVSPQSKWIVRWQCARTTIVGIGPYKRPAGGWGSQGEIAVAELAEQVAAVTLGNTVSVTAYVTASTALRIRALCQGRAPALRL